MTKEAIAQYSFEIIEAKEVKRWSQIAKETYDVGFPDECILCKKTRNHPVAGVIARPENRLMFPSVIAFLCEGCYTPNEEAAMKKKIEDWMCEVIIGEKHGTRH